MGRIIIGLLLCLAALAAQSSCAPINRQEALRTEAPNARLSSSLKVPLLDKGLRLSDFAGMAPRPDLKDRLAKISGFIQNSPHDGEPGAEDTEVWLGYTKTALYLVFICHDRHPEEIRSHLARRENILNDDNVTVILDTFHDHRLGVLFKVNAAGVQADAAWDDVIGSDYSYDQVWDSDGQVTREGWMALMAIPFRSLRFRPDGSDWGVVFQRSLPRNSETDFWPRVAANAYGYLSQEATLSGIEGVSGSHNLQIDPYVLGQNERTLETLDPLNPYFSSRHMEGTAGGEVKEILKDSIVLDATFNPDFSDIESEQPQFTVDQRYAVYFPELRPFFLENASYFNTPIQLVYTRNIIHPEYGIRATGKIGPANIGLFATDDRAPGEMVAPGDPLYNKRATYAVGRIFRDIGKGSGIGAIYTDEEFGQGWNRIGGVDFTAVFKKNWILQGQWVESSTQVNIDSTTTPAYSAGPASNIKLHRSGRSLSLDSVFMDYSSGFQSLVGFIPTTNIRTGQGHASYKWFPKHSVILNYGPETNQSVAYDHLGNRVFHYSSFDYFVSLPRNTTIAPIAGQNSDTLGPQNATLLAQNKNFTENFGGITAKSAPIPQFNFNITAIRGGNVNYNPVTCSDTPPIAAYCLPSLMNQENAQVLFTLQPGRQLTVD